MVEEDFARRMCKKVNEKLVSVFYGDEGMTDVQLVAYFLLFIAISTIAIFMAITIPEVHAKLWVKLNSDLFK